MEGRHEKTKKANKKGVGWGAKRARKGGKGRGRAVEETRRHLSGTSV